MCINLIKALIMSDFSWFCKWLIRLLNYHFDKNKDSDWLKENSSFFITYHEYQSQRFQLHVKNLKHKLLGNVSNMITDLKRYAILLTNCSTSVLLCMFSTEINIIHLFFVHSRLIHQTLSTNVTWSYDTGIGVQFKE